jgi:hypothetical protein
MQYVQQRGSTCVEEASLVSAHVQHDKCALVLLRMLLVLWHKRTINKRLLVAARKCVLAACRMEAPRASLVSAHLHSLQHNKCALVRPLVGHKSALVLFHKCALISHKYALIATTGTSVCALINNKRLLVAARFFIKCAHLQRMQYMQQRGTTCGRQGSRVRKCTRTEAQVRTYCPSKRLRSTLQVRTCDFYKCALRCYIR